MSAMSRCEPCIEPCNPNQNCCPTKVRNYVASPAVMPMVPSVPYPPPCFTICCPPCPPPCCPPPITPVNPVMPAGARITQPMLDVVPIQPIMQPIPVPVPCPVPPPVYRPVLPTMPVRVPDCCSQPCYGNCSW